MTAFVLALNCQPVPSADIRVLECNAHYIGPLEATIGARGIGGGKMGVGNGIECSTPGGRAGYGIFSRVLNLSEQDLEDIRRAGSPYRVGFHADAVVTIVGAEKAVIDYDGYVARAAYLRNLCIAGGIAAFLIGIGLFRLRDGDAASGSDAT